MGNAASIGRAIRADISKTVGEALVIACVELAASTPVDTTNAANNWILSTGSPFVGVDGSRENPSHAAQDAGIQRMRRYDVGRDGKVFLGNQVFYLQFLDDGWSQQAPPGFVAMVLAGASRRASTERRSAVQRMLHGMSHHAYLRTY